ncbi:DUF4292 domain-containing protein [Pontibacter silvestris]|uniref:DUF4292 domain-containing protein n=1 Tax=Pontibacter silvestris TaxID=2305183 RepID=A0ABW4WX97_9BACT|nr:DUF4292 domain-containing protein [Pontibacter silvestris]MCC9136345.1 DUF4292 domain-containing protein [Pontibacter silvestris]
MSKHILLCLLSLFLLASCKKESVPTTASATTETIGSVAVKNLDFTYLSAKSRFSLSGNGENLSSGVSLRMKKDSVIWMSVVPGLGIEAARMKLTQDSIYVMNRLRKEYTATDYNYLRSRLNVNINFNVLQAVLLGNYQPTGAEKVMDEAQLQHIQQLRQNLLFDYFVRRDQQKVQQLNIQDQQSGNNITVKYNNFQAVGPIPFAHDLVAQVIMQGGRVSDLTLNHSKVTVTDEVLTFPFNVPSDYKHLATN